MDRRLLNVKELSELTGLSENTIYCWVSQRRIPFVKLGRLTRFDLQKIEEWIEENSVEEKKFDHIRDRRSY
ncbi:hypothetical protein ES702_04476 [subsurface metagenome]